MYLKDGLTVYILITLSITRKFIFKVAMKCPNLDVAYTIVSSLHTANFVPKLFHVPISE